MVVFHQSLSSIKSHIPLKVVFFQQLSSIKHHLQSKVCSFKSCPPSNVIFNQRSTSIKGHLPSKDIAVIEFVWGWWWCKIIFVSTQLWLCLVQFELWLTKGFDNFPSFNIYIAKPSSCLAEFSFSPFLPIGSEPTSHHQLPLHLGKNSKLYYSLLSLASLS